MFRRYLTTIICTPEQTRVSELLSQNNIKFRVRTAGRHCSLSRNRRIKGSLGIDIDHAFTYLFYVNRKDFEKAKVLIQCEVGRGCSA